MIDVTIHFQGTGNEKRTMPAVPMIGAYLYGPGDSRRLWLVEDVIFDHETVNVLALEVPAGLAAEITAGWDEIALGDTGLQSGKPITPKRISRIITRIGKKAHVVVNRTVRWINEKVRDSKTGKDTGEKRRVKREVPKYASAHDLRQAFGTRWAPRVKPATLQLLMRHSSIETTLRYYVAQDADDVADELWGNWGNNMQKTESLVDESGNTAGNYPQEAGRRSGLVQIKVTLFGLNSGSTRRILG